MHKTLLLTLSAAAAGFIILSSPALAQQKTVKACQDEWRANKAANQAAGITERAFVAQCRSGVAATQPAPSAAPAAPARSAATPSAAAKPAKTVKACQEEWRANKAANQAAGITERAFVEQCRSGVAATQPAPAPAPATANAPPPSRRSTTAAAPPAAPTRTPSAAGSPMGAAQFSSEAQARARCPGDTIVWANLDSKIYHYTSNRNYGHTKNGAYMCEKDTAAAGIRAAKNEKHP